MNFSLAWRFINYRIFARHRGGHGIHSPFVFELLTKVIEQTENQFYAFREIENIRLQLMDSEVIIEVTDLGAGSKHGMSPERSIGSIVRNSSVKPKFGRLLFRLVNHFQPKIILELGTSLGISTLYMAAACRKSGLTTIEGCQATARQAIHNFSFFKHENICLMNSSFEQAIPEFLSHTEKLDFVFFDGDHRKSPTVDYFNLCLAKAHNDSVFVFDDIHWSREMEEAWETIKKNDKVVVTIDLFQFGLVFFRKEMSKQDFVIRF